MAGAENAMAKAEEEAENAMESKLNILQGGKMLLPFVSAYFFQASRL